MIMLLVSQLHCGKHFMEFHEVMHSALCPVDGLLACVPSNNHYPADYDRCPIK